MADSGNRFGFVAIVGRPNVGKSTLLNALTGDKLSIVSAKPHTTRHRVMGVMNAERLQVAFIDTPGHARRSAKALHRIMARTYRQAVEDADAIVLVVDASGLKADDYELFDALEDVRDRCVLVLNKIDKLKSRQQLLPLLHELQSLGFAEYVPLSASRKDNLDALTDVLRRLLPAGEPMFPPEYRTDKDLAFRIAEIIREKLFHKLRQEVPYGLTVEVESIGQAESGRTEVNALIWIERETHKPIVIGKGGRQLREIGRAARMEISDLIGENIHLNLWLKVREHWSDNERELSRLGYDDV